MSDFHKLEAFFIGTCLEGFFWGIYTAIFSIHLQHYISKEVRGDKKKNIIFYCFCALYVLSCATFAFDFAWIAIQYFDPTPSKTNILFNIIVISNVLYGCCNFLSQSIMIYRCWIVWSYNTYVVIIPTILTLTFIPIWLASIGAEFVSNNQLAYANWGRSLLSTTLAMSLAVNALVSGLILLRIFKVYWEVEPVMCENFFYATGANKFRSIVAAIIESAMALFALQVVLVVCSGVATEPASDVGNLTIGTHQMVLGIAPTIIQVRVSMGLPFLDVETMEEHSSDTASGLRFCPGSADFTQEMGGIVHKEPGSGCGTIDFQEDKDIKETVG